MAKFKPTPKPASAEPETKVESFIKAAETRSLEPMTPASLWAELDPNAKPTTGINLRLNQYQLERLRELARQEDRSIQYIVRKLLFSAVDQELSASR